MAGPAAPAASQAARSRPVRYREPGAQSAMSLLMVAPLLVPTLILPAAFGALKLGLILAGVEVLLAAAATVALSRVILLREDEIRIFRGFRFTNIGISEIAGVGMLFEHIVGGESGGRAWSFWRLYVWRDGGGMERTGLTFRPVVRTRGKSWAEVAAYDPVAASELPALNASRAAGIGRDLFRRVLGAQGSTGPLATRHLECHQPPVPLGACAQVIAYWSPDGQAGRCRAEK